MLGFNPGIYFLDIRVKPEYDNYLFVVPVFFFFLSSVMFVLAPDIQP